MNHLFYAVRQLNAIASSPWVVLSDECEGQHSPNLDADCITRNRETAERMLACKNQYGREYEIRAFVLVEVVPE